MDSKMPRIIAVSSGKGGVGKTNFVANLALFYASLN
ncbi:MAG: P-loop NTPase [Nitrospiraceae bacterium]|nr:P-loop NTPase [Nitrospiraceae bacterium]